MEFPTVMALNSYKWAYFMLYIYIYITLVIEVTSPFKTVSWAITAQILPFWVSVASLCRLPLLSSKSVGFSEDISKACREYHPALGMW
jgi:hypothetical protein